MASRKKKSSKQTIKSHLSPTELIIREIVESAQVVVIAVACIGIVCLTTYIISMAIIGIFAGPEMGRIGGFALSAVAGIAILYTIATKKNIHSYLDSLGKQYKIQK